MARRQKQRSNTPALPRSNLLVISHPLIQHNLTHLRDERTRHQEFRSLLSQTAGLMVYEVTRNFPLKEIPVTTPVARTRGKVLTQPIVLVPVLRAGLGMLDGILHLLPHAVVGHIGLFRHKKTFEAVQYYTKLPNNLDRSAVILIDPMLATGNSANAAATLLKEHGAKQISLVCLVASPEGLEKIRRHHPDVTIYTASVDKKLNAHAYIVPGLGDAGDRLFGT
ncbi:MAG: uracil phosphoribosyltransferase [Verrucomicrobiae bacterium]|nr:uracil phosphoribosyltransferase [Verrucomicrobiae bacterium]